MATKQTNNGVSEYPNDADESRPLQKRYDAEATLKLESKRSSQIQSNANAPVDEAPRTGSNPPKGVKGVYSSTMSRIEMPKRARIPFCISIVLCICLIVAIIILATLWPRVPDYMTAEVCVDKECLDASQQILRWSNISLDPCKQPYEWACGRFDKEYNQSFHGIYRGEWNFDADREYEEIRNLDFFISQLPSFGLLEYTPSILKGLYKSCREMETLDKSQANSILKKAINNLDGWKALRTDNWFHAWDHKKALTHLQTLYGSFPFFKVSVAKGLTPPYGKIITLEEGEVGLPHKAFYNLENNHKIITGYKMLLRDFAINMGVVAQYAELFADNIFHYEKRIVNQIIATEGRGNGQQNQIKSLEELKKLTPSLPIIETVQAIFPKTKITEKTEVLVRNVDVLQAMSIVVSTSDKQPLNDFMVWSLSRKFLPYLSREYRNAAERFEQILYGHKVSPRIWYFCAKTVREWLPFAIDALQQNDDLIKKPVEQNLWAEQNDKQTTQKPKQSNLNHELLKVIFYQSRNKVQEAFRKATWIDETIRSFVIKKLSSIKLQIGIPTEALQNHSFLNAYYEQFLLQNLFFVEHLEPLWQFEKIRMEKQLTVLEENDALISELYPGYGPERKKFVFALDLNTALVSGRIIQSPYFNFKYPLAFNFAHIGSDLIEVLLDAAYDYLEIYQKTANLSYTPSNFMGSSYECFSKMSVTKSLPQKSVINLHKTLSSKSIAINALNSLITLSQHSYSVKGALLDENTTYESLRLPSYKRQPGLQALNEKHIFTLASLQRHCSISLLDYRQYKPYVEGVLSDRDMFDSLVRNVPQLLESLKCPKDSAACRNIL